MARSAKDVPVPREAINRKGFAAAGPMGTRCIIQRPPGQIAPWRKASLEVGLHGAAAGYRIEAN